MLFEIKNQKQESPWNFAEVTDVSFDVFNKEDGQFVLKAFKDLISGAIEKLGYGKK